MLRRLLGSHADTVVAIDLFFLDTSNFGHIGWALLELSDPIVFEKMRSRFDNKPFVGNTVVRSFRATDQGISSFYRVKETTIRRKHLVSTTDPKGTSSRPSSATGTRPPPPPPLPSLPNSSRQPPRRPGDGSSPTTNDHTSNSPMSIASEMYCIGRKLNWVVDSSSLRPLVSPSRKAGMSASVEAMLQSKCTKIMLNVVKMLKFNREDASTAIVLFHRYVSVHPMNVSTVEWMAATCLHVVLKSHSRSLDWPAFVTAVYAAKYHGGGSSSAAQPSADELERVEHHVLSMEAALLDGLRYDISSTDPFAMLDACFRGGNLDDDNRAHKFGKRLVSDSLTATSLWTHFPVECLVVAVLYIASAAAVSANPDMPPPPPYLPRLPRSHRHTFDAAVAPLLTLFEATRCTDLPRSVLEERIRHFVDTQDAKDMPAIYFEPSNWPSAYLAWQSSHQAVQLTATHMENVVAIRRRAFVARIKAVGVPWPDLAGRPVYLQPWPYKQPHHATRGMPEACLRELSTLVNVHARDTALFVTLIGIVFPTQPQRVDDLLVLPSPSKPNNNDIAIDMFTDLFPGETADRTMPPISTAKRPVDDMHYLVFERPLHMLSTLLESTSDASIMSFATRKRIVFNLFRSVANGTQASVASLIEMLNGVTVDTESVEVVIAPPAIFLATAKANLKPEIQVSAQNVSLTGLGAYTGEIAAEHLVERRALYGETDFVVAEKTKRALDHGLNVILCVGESLDERKSDQTLNVITRQLKAVADLLVNDLSLWSRVVVAYEPVWAIGTGVVATPEQAQDAHKTLRAYVTSHINPEVASELRIIYGGSVNAKNSAELIALHDVDGFLVGGASLKPEFVDIIQSAQ
ncbi:hypothetical protein DYB36_000610 [Aphanomyces astaci]|uniref:Cyclin N-terminal domain-containing protein n=1 Tax=Aphanomyces astaci TaxID=112090 RepID=A0A397A9P6_APHAT|nr:hypothetical protein DYB36_000610 [Aphanomyces astaci]